MKIWIDDIRPAPKGYQWCKTVNQAINMIQGFEDDVENALDEYDYPSTELWNMSIELIDIDHDAGIYVEDGGDYIKFLNWLEETGRNYPIHIHSMNPVGIANMRRIIEKNGWKEIR